MKKYVVLGIVVIIAICGIGGIFYINSFREAEIILSFICDDTGEERDIAFFINKDGCIYKTEDQKFIGNPNIGDFLKNNSNYAEDEKYTFIRKIEEKEIKEKIRILKKIAIRNADIEIEERLETDIRGDQKWYGYY